MSFRKSINNKSSNVKKPFCKVCQDAGKPESEYTSHFVRSRPDKNGKTTVTCPVLAATECRYCFQLGHTTKFCPVIEENNKRTKKYESRAIQSAKAEQRSAARPVKETRKPSGAFDVLAYDSDDDKRTYHNRMFHNVKSIPAVKVVDEFPALVEGIGPAAKPPNASLKPVTAVTVSWAAMAEKPAPPVYKQAPPKVETETKKEFSTKSWADWSDSDDDELDVDADGPWAIWRQVR
jgi:hypothetical protein